MSVEFFSTKKEDNTLSEKVLQLVGQVKDLTGGLSRTAALLHKQLVSNTDLANDVKKENYGTLVKAISNANDQVQTLQDQLVLPFDRQPTKVR